MNVGDNGRRHEGGSVRPIAEVTLPPELLRRGARLGRSTSWLRAPSDTSAFSGGELAEWS